MDANFHLKNQMVLNYSQDLGLGTGLAFMVQRVQYEQYVLSHASDADVRIFLPGKVLPTQILQCTD